jgi:exodeoxyribonuclease V gamma subunit
VAELLGERLSEGSGRFGHRSGALTISALEPMRAIPHKVVVLMGLDAGSFPRQRQRPGFHLLEQERRLGDPNSGDQDRYVLLESLLSARQHLLLSWSNRDERTGESLEASTPVRQWLEWLRRELPEFPVREHCANPLERGNFLAAPPWPPASCDERLLQARRQLEQRQATPPPMGLAFSTPPPAVKPAAASSPTEAWSRLRRWLQEPQRCWLEDLGLRPRECDTPVLDRDALELDERQRAGLLRDQLDPMPEELPNWLELERGRGQLPPEAAGELEVQRLQQRWQALALCLEQLGEARSARAGWCDLEADLHWRSDALVLLHAGRPRTAQRLGLWLDLLLASAAGEAPRQAVLVGRDSDRFRVLERYEAPDAAAAAELLAVLRHWQAEYQGRCWPLPPETGWAWAAAEEPRRWQRAQEAWEGGYQRMAERRDAVQAVCFGADLPVAELLSPELQALALELHTPLLERRQEVKR